MKECMGGVTLQLEIEKPLRGNSFEFEGEDADLTGTVNSVEVTVTIGDDTGITTVTAGIEEDDEVKLFRPDPGAAS